MTLIDGKIFKEIYFYQNNKLFQIAKDTEIEVRDGK